MRDWEAYVRGHLALPELARGREARIVRELAAQLEDFYRDALARGQAEADADAFARGQVTDWTGLAASLRRADRSYVRSHVDRWSERLDDAAQAKGTRWIMIADLWQDLRYASRQLAAQRGFTGVAILTLALGIGANTAVFSLVNAVLLQPLPAVADPPSLVAVFDATRLEEPRAGVPFPTFRALAGDNRTFDRLAGFIDLDVALQAPGRSALVQVTAVSGEYFPLLGVTPQLGRLMGPLDDEAPLASPVVVLSDGVWSREFARAPDILGQTVRLGPTSFTVIGVAPRGFRGTHLTRTPDFWVPLTMIQGLDVGGFLSGPFSKTLFTTFRGYGWIDLVGRLRPGVAPPAAAADLTQLLHATRPAASTVESRIDVVPIVTAAAITDRTGVVRFVALLAGVVALILLLACLNLATLLLVRAAGRARELGVRAALGAGRARLVRGLFAESLLLALAGGLAGLGLGVLVMRLLAAFTLPGNIAIDALALSLDRRVLIFGSLLACATTFIFGLVPALRASRTDPAIAFRSQVRGGSGTGPRPALLAAQIAISLVILVTAALFLRSLRAGLQTDIGFDPRPLAAATVELRLHGYSSARAADFYRQVRDGLERAPGVERAAVASDVPLAPTRTLAVRPVGAPDSEPARRVGRNFVTPGYFQTLGVPLLAGRDFAATDAPRTPLVAVLNESAARALWPDGQAVGRRLVDRTEREYTVIGVVRNTKYQSLADAESPFLFYSILQEIVTGKVSVIARDSGSLDSSTLLRGAILDVDPIVAATDVRRVDDQVEALLMPQRFGSVLLTGLGALAVAIAAVGIYAALAYAVAMRRTEFGIRIALGAARRDVLALVLRRMAATVGVGVAVGLLASAAAARAVGQFLFGIEILDATAFGASMCVLVLVLAAASVNPARRAWRIDPVEALRGD